MAKDSRLIDIFRQELKNDKGIMGAFLSAASERGKEKSDIRNILPKSGFSGAIAEKMFGKSYRYNNKKDNSKVERVGGDISSSKYLPGMAKDMNLMRLNMQKLVTLAGGKPSKTPSTSLLKGKTPTVAEKKETGSSGGGILSGIMGGIGGIAGGILGGIGSLAGGILSIGGSVISGIASLIGGIAGGLFSIIGGAMSAMGPLGLILAAGAGFIIYGLSQSIDFGKIKTSFGSLYKDITDGIKGMLGISDDPNAESLLTKTSKKLDDYFGTTKFSDSLKFVKDTFSELSGRISDEVSFAFQTIQKIFGAMAQDIYGYIQNFWEENRTLIFAGIGAGLIQQGGPVGPSTAPGGTPGKGGLGGAANVAKGIGMATAGKGVAMLGGAAAGAVVGYLTSEDSLKDLQKKIPDTEKRIREIEDARKQTGDPNLYGSELDNLKESLKLQQERKKLLESRTGNLARATGDLLNKHNEYIEAGKAERVLNRSIENSKTPASTSPQKVTGTSGSSYAESIAKGESGGNYNIVYGSKHEINGKPVVENTIGEVIAWQKSMAGTNRQAAGKYQFMNVAAEAEKAGLSMNDKFDGVSQEKMMATYTAANAATLNRLGLEASAENLSMAHAVGVGGTKKLLDAQRAGMGNANSLQVLGLSGNAASTNPQLNNSVDYTIARLSNKVKGMPAPLPPTETQNLALAENKKDDLFGEVLDILRQMLSGDTKQSAPTTFAGATPNTTRSTSTAYNDTKLFDYNFFYTVGPQYNSKG
jgi:hypothetical protein